MPKKTIPRATTRTTPPIPVRAVDFVMVCAPEMAPTRKFYRELFGLKRGGEWNSFWSEFKTEPITLCLNASGPSTKWDWSGPPAIAFAVDDIHQALAECRRRKVEVLSEPVETSVCWMAFIADPAGNRICLHQRKNGTAG